MRRTARALPTLLIVLGLGLTPVAAGGQELYTFTIGALGGFGGSLDADPGDDLDNTALQLNLALVIEPKTHFGLRLGRLDLDVDDSFEGLTGADLTYLTAAGEYRFEHGYYESGIYAGLGAYRLEGRRLFDGGDEEDTSFGVVLGITGEFDLTRRLGLLVEISGHWADLEPAQLYLLGHLGLAFHF